MNRTQKNFAALVPLCAAVTGAAWFYSAPADKPTEKPVKKDSPVANKEQKGKVSVKPALLSPEDYATYKKAIDETSAMVTDPEAQKLAQKYGLQILNLTWEDTGRYKDSSVGPNISDMTIQVGARDPKTEQFSVSCMPVIRFPNFSDKSTDLDPRDFTLLVGNQADRSLRRVSLRDFLNDPRAFLTRPWTWKGGNKSLLAPKRDDKVLVSAQACFLPVPKKAKATFNPVLFNYQSYSGDPAVLTVLVTREGTSTTIIDNKRDAFEAGSAWGQRLFHNANGQRASLTGERESDFLQHSSGKGNTPVVGHGNKKESGLNMVLLIQIPLKQKQPMRYSDDSADMAAAPTGSSGVLMSRKSDVENAVIGHGDLEGPYTEMDNVDIERDPQFPVRVTVQFYKATSNGVASEADIKAIKEQIDRVYSNGKYVGSLVTEGETGRLTEYEGVKVEPRDWWEKFWQRHQQNTGDTREEAIRKLRKLLNLPVDTDYRQMPVSDLYLRDLMRRS